MRRQSNDQGAWPFRRVAWLVVGFLLGSATWGPPDIAAQDRRPRPWGGHYEYRHGPRAQVGAGFAYIVPRREFGVFVDDGYGVGVHFVYGLDPSNVLGLRFDAGWVRYGTERIGVPVFPGTGRVLFDVATHNNIAMFGIGPQIQVPKGPFRPYLNGFVGTGYFYTESSFDNDFHSGGFGSTTNFDDVSFGYGGGGGLALVFGSGRHPLSVDFDVQWRRYPDTEYLVEGSIWEDEFGDVFISPLLSDVEFLHFTVGMSVGF